MLENLTLLDLASAAARHATARHRVIAENVANADTPGYRARDLKDFSAIVKESFNARATRPGHLGFAGQTRPPRTFELALPPSPNGNTVNIEDQAIRAVQAQGQHALALAIYAKAIDILRLGLGRAR
ncbi:MAG: FlgB family protein [Proteobacteria bacterium]|nr:FlgB family protein [Pseudomonadota bacterium]